jgi:ribosomal protein L37E
MGTHILSEMQAVCSRCGFVAYNDTKSCLKWCRYARQCVGNELYERFLRESAPES